MPKVIIKLGADTSTDDIYPGRYMATVLPTETPSYCFADRTEFNTRLQAREFAAGSIILGGENFGCGSSREQAVSAIHGHGLVVVAKSVSRIFLQNAINLGLRTVICPTVEAEEGQELVFQNDQMLNQTTGEAFPIQPLPPARQAIVDAGGLIPYTRKRIMKDLAR